MCLPVFVSHIEFLFDIVETSSDDGWFSRRVSQILIEQRLGPDPCLERLISLSIEGSDHSIDGGRFLWRFVQYIVLLLSIGSHNVP